MIRICSGYSITCARSRKEIREVVPRIREESVGFLRACIKTIGRIEAQLDSAG